MGKSDSESGNQFKFKSMKDRETVIHSQRAGVEPNIRQRTNFDVVAMDNGRYQQSASYELRAEDL